MGVLIDTSVLIDLERKGRPLGDFLDSVDAAQDFGIASITASELLQGIFHATPESRRIQRIAFIEHVIQRIPIMNFDLAVARVHARLRFELQSTGLPIGPNDLIIAATAVFHQYSVLTHNVTEFSQVVGLEVQQASV
jgi:predicted nucleic acid-binding protein